MEISVYSFNHYSSFFHALKDYYKLCKMKLISFSDCRADGPARQHEDKYVVVGAARQEEGRKTTETFNGCRGGGRAQGCCDTKICQG